MKQVKFFKKEYQNDLEEAVNMFIKNKDIVSVSYSTSIVEHSGYHYCCVVYSV